MPQHVQRADYRAWLAIAALGTGNFSIVTAELAPIGLLSQIGGDLGVPTGQVGLIVTLYAWIAAVAAIASAVWLGSVPRRPLLIGLMTVLAASGFAASLSESFAWLMGARVLGPIAHGAFWAMIGTLGAQIVPARQVGLATSIIFGGVSVASVLGVPFANLVGIEAGWRIAFLAIGMLSLGIALAMWITVPTVQGTGNVGVRPLIRILSNSRFQRIFAATLFAVTAHFMAYTYIEPFLTGAEEVSIRAVAPLLFTFGAAGIAANMVTGALIDTWLKMIVMVSLLLACGALSALSLLGASIGTMGIALVLFIWGGAIAAILVGLQTWVLKEAGADALQASAIYVALFNGAIGLGAALGAVLLETTGLSSLFLCAAVLVCVSFISIAALREPKTTPAE
ncbi:MFS transporter [Shimia marina]|uniref:Sugar efflux transporter B n=1 Tax=Shimia marina TaxID=321267 RepID=A0A0N7LRH2_9RHOB|nr:MFS transporter [Shimia marina]CUH50812.1 Sugar efflux transporter B [Shimia marina]SFE66566.1 Predicted arabinose efflux permease, MFS family [Shimia marina]